MPSVNGRGKLLYRHNHSFAHRKRLLPTIEQIIARVLYIRLLQRKAQPCGRVQNPTFPQVCDTVFMDDREIIALYFRRDEAAIAESQQKYGGYCGTIARNITTCPEDAEECVSETWLRAWNAIPPQRPLFLKAFFAKITRNLALDRVRRETAESRGGGAVPLALDELSECLPSAESVEAQVDARELGRAISRFVRGLKQRDGDLFLRRYFYMDTLEAAASHVGMSPKHAAVSLHRSRKRLEEFLKKEGLI